ncbi:hypothetical protein C0991_000286 [Blastosporella zonata]|nr:hypothetical protein C0991_000286 [Blastosporella zonata]
MDDPRAQLALLDAEILRLTKLLQKLTNQRVPLKRAINRHCAPFLALPVELCALVFTYADVNPLRLGAVCMAWRNLAWDMPWLWANLDLTLTKDSSTHMVTLLAEWTNRAMAPMDVRLKIRLGGTPHININTLFGTVSELVRSIHLDFDHPALFELLGAPLLPRLETANLSLAIPSNSLPATLLSRAPALRVLHLSNLPPTHLSSLTHLHLTPTTISTALLLFPSLPALTHLTLTNITASNVLDPRPVPAPALTHLCINTHGPTPLSELLDLLVLPRLHALHIDLPNQVFPVPSFVGMIARSGCLLSQVRMRLKKDWGGREVLRQIMRQLPGLETVDVRAVEGAILVDLGGAESVWNPVP